MSSTAHSTLLSPSLSSSSLSSSSHTHRNNISNVNTNNSSSSKTELKRFSHCHYYLMKYYNYYQYNKDGFKPIRRFFAFVFSVFVLYVAYDMCLRLFPELDMVIHSRCYSPLATWNGKLFSWTIMKTSLQTRHEIYNLHSAKKYDDIIVFPPEIEENASPFSSSTESNPASYESKIQGQAVQNQSNNRHNKPDLRYLRTALPPPGSEITPSPANKKLVLFGTHHKTGTYLAKKLFSKLCAKYDLCCQFHITRDSLYSVYKTIEEEPADIIGHTQWIWYPYELNLNKATTSMKPTALHSSAVDYKFIHFYRHPFYKIISSYYYHLAGSEKWNEKALPFYTICPNIEKLLQESNVVASKHPERRSKEDCIKDVLYEKIAATPNKAGGTHAGNEDCEYSSNQRIDRSLTFDYCESTYLCETCCRKEHEYAFSEEEYSSTPALDRSLLASSSSSSLSSQDDLSSQANSSNPDMRHHQQGKYHQYQIRQLVEYQFLCQYLGEKIPPSSTLQQALQQSSLVDGLLIEAALNYYEILRMAKIVNYTWHDTNSLNINLERLTRDYEHTIKDFLRYLQPTIETAWLTGSSKFHTRSASDATEELSVPMKELSKELSFYNLHYSFLYRWSMSNPFHNHITNEQAHEEEESNRSKEHSSRRDLFDLLANHPVVARVYSPILQLMTQALA